MKILILGIFFFIISSCFSLASAKKYIYHTSDRLFYDAKNKVFELSGNVNIFYEDTKISCNIFRYYEDKKYGLAQGNPRLYNPRVFIRSKFVEIYFENKQAIGKDNVYIRVKNDEKEKQKKQWDYFDIYTNKLIYNWSNQNIFIPNNVTIVSKDIYLTSNQLIYNDKNKIILLKGNVQGRNKDQFIRADKVTYDINKDTMKIEGNVKSVIRVSNQDKQNDINTEEKLISLQISEIYDNVIKENTKIIDYFISKNGYVPSLEIHVSYYSKIEVYKELLDYKINYPADIEKYSLLFIPVSLANEIYTPAKVNVLYFLKDTPIVFERYSEFIEYIGKNIKFIYNPVMFSDISNVSIAVFDDKDKSEYNKEMIYSTIDQVYGYYINFRNRKDSLDFFYLVKDYKVKNLFFLIDEDFWRGFNFYKDIVFNNYDFKVNLLIDVKEIEKLFYDVNTQRYITNYLLWKSYLYDCRIYVNKRIYGGTYFKVFDHL